MWKKREIARYRYSLPDYKKEPIKLTDFLNELHSVQLDYLDEALENSDLKEAKEVIAYIKGKL